MSIERKDRIIAVHADAIISHFDQRLATILDCNAYVARLSVNGILDQFLDDRSWALNDFASRDLIRDRVWKNGNATGCTGRHPLI
jgi:hypothetical protein